MRSSVVEMLPLWRTPAQARLVYLLSCDSSREWTLTELGEQAAVAPSTAHQEVTRLLRAELITDRRIGRSRLIRFNETHPISAAIAAMAAYTFAPPVIIGDCFSEVGAARVLIFGSWAHRHAGEPGPRPHDIDVLVLAASSVLAQVRKRAFAAAERAEARIGMPVHVVVRDESSWDDPTDPLIGEIRGGEYVSVIGETRP